MIIDKINEIEITLLTDNEVFSPKGIDIGTKAMLSFVELNDDDKVLDLGCGYGIVGIWAAKQIGSDHVTMCDISAKAVECSKKNAVENGVSDNITILQSDGLSQITDTDYTLILSNPPYHVDFSVPKHFIEDGFRKLKLGGKMIMVVKRKDWYQNKLTAVFGGVTVREKDGYFIFIAQKRKKRKQEKPQKENKLSKKLSRKYKNT